MSVCLVRYVSMSEKEITRTTIRLDNGLLRQAKAEAAKRHQTLTSLIEEGLRLALAARQEPGHRRKIALPVSRRQGGVLPGVDLNSNADLLDIMDGIR